jgi:hypothetical protein
MTWAGRVVCWLLAAPIAAACSGGALQPDAGNPSTQPDVAIPPAGYTGCSYGGGYSHIIISKCDADRSLVFLLGLALGPSEPVPPGLTLPGDWKLSLANAGDNMRSCPTQTYGCVRAVATGTVDWPNSKITPYDIPSKVNLDVTLSFEPNDAGVPASEPITAQNVDVSRSCEPFSAAPECTL